MVRRGSRGRGARGARQSPASNSPSTTVPVPTETRGKRGRGRSRRSTEPSPVESPVTDASLAAEITNDGRRVSRRQKMPNKRLMPITNGRLAERPTAVEPSPAGSPSPARVARAARARGGLSVSSRGSRGARRKPAAVDTVSEPAATPAETDLSDPGSIMFLMEMSVPTVDLGRRLSSDEIAKTGALVSVEHNDNSEIDTVRSGKLDSKMDVSICSTPSLTASDDYVEEHYETEQLSKAKCKSETDYKAHKLAVTESEKDDKSNDRVICEDELKASCDEQTVGISACCQEPDSVTSSQHSEPTTAVQDQSDLISENEANEAMSDNSMVNPPDDKDFNNDSTKEDDSMAFVIVSNAGSSQGSDTFHGQEPKSRPSICTNEQVFSPEHESAPNMSQDSLSLDDDKIDDRNAINQNALDSLERPISPNQKMDSSMTDCNDSFKQIDVNTGSQSLVPYLESSDSESISQSSYVPALTGNEIHSSENHAESTGLSNSKPAKLEQPMMDGSSNQELTSTIAVGDSASGEALEPPSPVRFKDPLENSADPIDLEATAEDISSKVEESDKSLVSDKPVLARVDPGSVDANGCHVDKSGSVNVVDAPELEMDTPELTNDGEASCSPTAQDIQNRNGSGSPPAEPMEVSRSPAVADGGSAVGDALDSRSPVAGTFLEGHSPGPPPDPDDNACSFPSIPSKASDSEDSIHAPLPTLPATPPVPEDRDTVETKEAADMVARTAALSVSRTSAPPLVVAAPASPQTAVEDERVSCASPVPGYSEDELDDPTGELAALWPPPPTCGTSLPDDPRCDVTALWPPPPTCGSRFPILDEDSQSHSSSPVGRRSRPESEASLRDENHPTSLNNRLKKQDVKGCCSSDIDESRAVSASPSGHQRQDACAPATSDLSTKFKLSSSLDSTAGSSKDFDVCSIPLPPNTERWTPGDGDKTPSDSERTPMPSAESSLSTDAFYRPAARRIDSNACGDRPASMEMPIAIPSTCGTEIKDYNQVEDNDYRRSQSPVDMDISRSPSPVDKPGLFPEPPVVSSIPVAAIPLPADPLTMAPPAPLKVRQPSQDGSVRSEDRASPFMGMLHSDEESPSPLVTHPSLDEHVSRSEVAKSSNLDPSKMESLHIGSPKRECLADEEMEVETGLAGKVINSYIGIRKQKSESDILKFKSPLDFPKPEAPSEKLMKLNPEINMSPEAMSIAMNVPLQNVPTKAEQTEATDAMTETSSVENVPLKIASVLQSVPASRVLLKTPTGVRVMTKEEIEAISLSGPPGRAVIIRQGPLPSGTKILTPKSGKTGAGKPDEPPKKPVEIPKFKFSSVPSPTPEEMEACKPRDSIAADVDDIDQSSDNEPDANVLSVVDAAHREAVEQKARQQATVEPPAVSAPSTPRPRKPKSVVMERYAASSAGSPNGKTRAGADSGEASSTDLSVDPTNIPLPPTAPPPPAKRRGRPPKSAAAVPVETEVKEEEATAAGKNKSGKDSRVDAIQDKDLNKLRKFKVIQDVIWLKKPKLTKQQKEAHRMVCDCSPLSSEEIERGEMGCGEDCLNRLLMVECGPRCPLGDRCSNKRFSKRERYPTEVFKTEFKGYGLRASSDMPADAFIYEYVGEVLDGEEFRRRTAEYDRLKYHHYYFMALKADAVIDATEKGNDSRFINHSCDPNAETQKWTVNGELRIGFFTKRPIPAGEEITFDYQLQRYGKEAQKCFCGSDMCRGWIGEKTSESDDEYSDEESESESEHEEAESAPAVEAVSAPPSEAAKAAVPTEEGAQGAQPPAGEEEPRPPPPVKPVRRVRQRKDAEKRVLESEISKLVASGLKSKQHTLELSRLMVRAESDADRLTLLELIRSADKPCRRLFLDYHGLKLMWSWMASPGDQDWRRFRLQMLETLAVLPIPNKTTLKDSKVLSVVERWASATPSTPDLETPDQTPSDAGDDPVAKEVSELAARLLESWAGLKEVFRIPKKERVELMREHEKEADRGYQTYLQQHREVVTADKKGYDCSTRKRAAEVPESDPRLRKYRIFSDSRMTKEERRQLFMLEVQREEAEQKQRQQQQELWRSHEKRCGMLGLDPFLTPIFDPSYQYYWEPSMGAWQPYTPGDPSVPLVPAPGVDPLTVAALPQQLAVYQTLAAADPTQAERYLEQIAQQRVAPLLLPPPPPPDSAPGAAGGGAPDSGQRLGLLEMLQAQLPGHFVDDSGARLQLPPASAAAAFSGYRLATYCDPSLPNVCVIGVPLPEVVSAPQPPPPPPLPTVTLPPDWRVNKDSQGRIYYYNKATRLRRWTPPPVPDWTSARTTVTESVWTGEGSVGDASPEEEDGSSSSSDSDSSSSSEDEADKKADEEDDSGVSELPEDMAKEEEIDRRCIVKHRHRGKRRDRLVQERVISPVPELSKAELRRQRHRQKRAAKAEARRERRQERLAACVDDSGLDDAGGATTSRPQRVKIPGLSSPPPDADADEEHAESGGTEDMDRLAAAEQDEAGSPSDRGDEATLTPESDTAKRDDAVRKIKAKEEALRKRDAKKDAAAREKRKIAARVAARALLKAEAKAAAKAEAKAAAKAEVRAAREARETAAAEAAAAAAKAARNKRRHEELNAWAEDAARLAAGLKKRKVELKRPSSAASTGSEPSGGGGGGASTAATTTAAATAAATAATDQELKEREKPTTAAADTSSEVARKIKDKFVAQMSGVVVAALNQFRKSSCKQGRIASTDDFKYLAKKLTHHVMIKELKNVQQVEELSANDSVKHKAKYYVKKYMGRYGPVYSRAAATDEVEPTQ